MNDENVAAFVSLTNISPEEASRILEAHGGNLQAALSSYFDNQATASESQQPQASRDYSRENSLSRASSSVRLGRESRADSVASGRSSRSLSRPQGRPRIATFSDLTRNEEALEAGAALDGGSAINDDDDLARLYAGGEKSAIEVQNPNRDRSNRGSRSNRSPSRGRTPVAPSLVEQIIAKAMRVSSEEPADDDMMKRQGGRSFGSGGGEEGFKGRGFRLGAELSTLPSETMAITSVPQSTGISGDSSNEVEKVQRTLTFWRNGFSIDDGPLYAFDDPRNTLYLRAINMGRAPIELLHVGPNQAVDVRVEQRTDEDYVRARTPPTLSNSGDGQRLGSSLDMPTGLTTAVPTGVPSARQQSQLGREGDIVVQIRTADGQAHRCHFNRQDPVQRLYDYVQEATGTTRQFVLEQTWPVKPLEDRQQTLEDAGVISAVVAQRYR